MGQRILTDRTILEFTAHLQSEERAGATVEKYRRDVQEFTVWLSGRAVSKEEVMEWREHLLQGGRSPATVNAKLSALNSLFSFLDWADCRVKCLKIQRRIFRDQSRELTKGDFTRLLEAARSLGRERLLLVMETICSTGIRVSELQYITVEAAQSGSMEVRMKGKIRYVFLPNKLCRKLLKYAKKQKTISGEIFITGNGTRLSRKQIWQEMKALCKKAGVEASRVFPHNLRHLFATAFYKACKDIVKLADVLGHSSIETTRIYLMTTRREHARCLDRLGLIS